MAVDLRKLEEIFHGAVTVEPDSRADYLDSACHDDDDLRHEVESLVAAYESGGGLLEENAVTLALEVLGKSSNDSMIGQEIGPYKILSALGQGGMGSVYLAQDSRLDRKVALKFLSGEFVMDNWAKRQLIKEAQAVARLDHPNICAVYGFDEIGDHSFIVMQHIEGQTLADLIRTHALKPDRIVPLAQQIVSALAEAHAHGIIHRDIKPKNIMVTPSEQVKVLDFGLAKTVPKTLDDATESISQLSKSGLLVGTIAYMSPEQLRGEKLDYRSDIFSMGTVLYEMACGRNPYVHKTNAEIISAIMSREPESLREVSLNCPRDLERIVDKCLRKDRAERYQSAVELLIDLDNVQKGITLPLPIHKYVNVRYAGLAAMLLLIFAVIMAVYRSWPRSDHTLAILPIVCEGLDPSTQCMGPAMTQNLVRAFSHRSGLRVTSSRIEPSLWGPQAASPEKVGRDLNADTVLYGRIRRGEKGLILTTRLQSVKDGSRIAEESYALNPDQTSMLEQQLSLDTAYYLHLPINEDDKNLLSALAVQQNRNAEAMQLYATGRMYWSKRDGENIQSAINNFRQATEKDPLFARAWAGLADCYVFMNSPAYGELTSKDAMVKAEFAAKQALAIDDGLAEAHSAYATVLMKGRWDWENAEKEFKKAIAVNPDYSPAHWGYSNLLSHTGRMPEALAESELAMNLDPFYPAATMNHCRTLYYARQFDQANTCLDRLAAEHPTYAGGKYMHGMVYIELGKLQEATQIYEEIYARDKLYGGAMLGFCYGIANRRSEAERVLAEMRELAKTRWVPDQELGIIYLGLNDLDRALPLLSKSIEEKFPPSQALSVSPMFDRFRSDRRFAALARPFRPPSNSVPSSASVSTSTK